MHGILDAVLRQRCSQATALACGFVVRDPARKRGWGFFFSCSIVVMYASEKPIFRDTTNCRFFTRNCPGTPPRASTRSCGCVYAVIFPSRSAVVSTYAMVRTSISKIVSEFHAFGQSDSFSLSLSLSFSRCCLLPLVGER